MDLLNKNILFFLILYLIQICNQKASESYFSKLTKLKYEETHANKLYKDPLIQKHKDVIKSLQEKTKKTACLLLLNNLINKAIGRLEFSDAINKILKGYNLVEHSNEYFDMKEVIYDQMKNYILNTCVERINSESTISKLLPKTALVLTEDEELFIFNILYSFEMNDSANKLRETISNTLKDDL